MGDFSSFIDTIGQQNELSGLQQWAAAGGASADPNYSQLAQLAPRAYQQIVPSLIQKQQEATALQQYYGQPAQQAPDPSANNPTVPQGVPLDADNALAALSQQKPDANGITWNGPSQQPPPNPQATALSKVAAIANLPPALQGLAAQQLQFLSQPNSGLTGDDFLKTLPPGIADTVKGIAQGTRPYPTGNSAKNPMGQFLQQAVGQYEPGFDATQWAQRNKTVLDFNSTGGKSRQSIVAIETALNHLSDLQDKSDALGQAGGLLGGKWGNSIKNEALDLSSDPDYIAYNNVAKTAADEVAKATAGPGGSTEGDRANRLASFTADNNLAGRKAAIQSSIELLNGRLEPLAEGYNNAMGTAMRPTELLSPKAQVAYAKIMGQPSPNVTASGNYNPAQDQPQPMTQTQPNIPQSPQQGIGALAQIAAERSQQPQQQPQQQQLSPLQQLTAPDITPDVAKAELARRAKLRKK